MKYLELTMNEPGFTDGNTTLSQSRIAIMGLGLMGGSLAMALTGKVREIIGIDPDPLALQMAEDKRVFDLLDTHPGNLLKTADLVILAMPVLKIIQVLAELPGFHPGNPVVMDLGSTKVDIVTAMNCLPARFDPLGAHPMCGKEKSTLAAADANLFKGSPFVFTRLERSSNQACSLAAQIAEAVHSKPLWLDAETHDKWVASTSHMPYLAACALASATPIEASLLAGSGYASTTRVATTSPDMMLDVLITNRENVLAGLNAFRQHLDDLQMYLDHNDFDALKGLLHQAASHQEEILTVKQQACLP
jgi:prephenate dehydrogenase